IIRKKLESLSNLLEKLEEIISKRENSNEKNIKEYLLFAAVKKAEECVELAITINQSLLESKNKIADSYYESFTELKNFEKFEENELKQLASTTGFRNRLAHEYLPLMEK
ncbi:MAG: HepT-like ribonuclease domain-containing protein, partial [Candidatus Pacearchaeota archaeon]